MMIYIQLNESKFQLTSIMIKANVISCRNSLISNFLSGFRMRSLLTMDVRVFIVWPEECTQSTSLLLPALILLCCVTYSAFPSCLIVCNLSCARNAITLGTLSFFFLSLSFHTNTHINSLAFITYTYELYSSSLNEIASADKKNNAVIIMFKASDANKSKYEAHSHDDNNDDDNASNQREKVKERERGEQEILYTTATNEIHSILRDNVF